MGMYTGLKGKIKIKEEKKPAFLDMLSAHYNDNQDNNCWAKVLPDHKWLEFPRNNFIPFGSLCYMPDNWYRQNTIFDLTTSVFEFACSLKNYQGEIEFFIESVLPEIADGWELEYFYEEDQGPTLYEKGAVV